MSSPGGDDRGRVASGSRGAVCVKGAKRTTAWLPAKWRGQAGGPEEKPACCLAERSGEAPANRPPVYLNAAPHTSNSARFLS